MSKFWADVTLGKLQTEYRIPEGYQGEYRIRMIPNMQYRPSQAFSVLLSGWVAGKVGLEYNSLFHLYSESLEEIRRNPESIKRSTALVAVVAKYGLDNILYFPEWFRKQLIRENALKPILYSPRALGSQKLQNLLKLKFRVLVVPGLAKSDFPEESYIGVGYRDKGHSRKVELDGSPSWQELAVSDISSTQEKQVNHRDFHLALILQENWEQLRRSQVRRSRKMRIQEYSFLD